jgi:uncharacterized protein YbjT (DUF2867 family)
LLVIFGANGRTGVEVLKLALARDMPVKPIVRDDRDVKNLHGVVPVIQVSYADPDHPDSLGAVLQGATQVLSCIDARTAGPQAPRYGRKAPANIIQAATAAGAQVIVHLTVMGAYRWSPAKLNRHSFNMDESVRNCTGPWGLLRVSCYHDEILEAHMHPPDEGRPHKVPGSSRYSPVSRSDAARMLLDHLQGLTPGRAPCVGGPRVYDNHELTALLSSRTTGSSRRATTFRKLPPGDISVSPETTRRIVGYVPEETLEEVLGLPRPASTKDRSQPVYAQLDPGPHPSDLGRDYKVLSGMGPALRRVVHDQLVEDAGRIVESDALFRLDFSRARSKKRTASAHDGHFQAMSGVALVDEDGEILHRGAVEFLRDELAEVFFCWWVGEGIPARVWDQLDLGVRRRLVEDPHFTKDPRVELFSKGRPEVVSEMSY